MDDADKIEYPIFKVAFSFFKVVREVCSLADRENHFVRLPDGTADAENGVAGSVRCSVCAADDAADGAD